MKHSISLKFMWNDRELPERARRAAEHNFDMVELWDWRHEPIDELAAACRETGIEIAGFFGHSYGGLRDPSQRDEVLSSLAESVEVAQRVGATQLHMFSDDIGHDSIVKKPPSLPWESQWQSCLEGLRECAALVEGKSINLVLESINTVFVPGYFLSHAGHSLALCRAIDHPQVTMFFDCFHQQLVAGRLIENLVEALPWTQAVHIADVPGRHQPGTGEINFHGIKRVLDEQGYDRQLTFETVPKDDDSETAVTDIKEVWAF
ncbi:MAG: TIM barrel protein [Actinomycetota bacterium]|nr:TIM barrel protein [Actinomycetota bacterium]